MTVKKKAGVDGPVDYRSGAIEIEVGDTPLELEKALAGQVPEAALARVAASVAKSLVDAGHCEVVEEADQAAGGMSIFRRRVGKED